MKIVDFKNIIYCKAEGNYTRIYCKDFNITVAKNLMLFESRLPSNLFLRIHRSLLINSLYIEDIKNNTVVLKSGIELQIARRKKRAILKFLSTKMLVVK